MSIARGRARVEAVDTDAAVTPLELFFDLVFVFGLVQITTFMAADLSWRGLLHGVLIIGLLWWSWVCYAWVGNVARADEGAPCERTGQLLEQRIAEIDHTLRELRELRATLVAARRTGADRAGAPKNRAGGVCPMIDDATTAAGRS